MEGTEVIGAFLAEELAKGGFPRRTRTNSIYVISPEFNNNSQIIFRDNLIPMIRDKHVMILMASVTTGRTLNKAVESIQYYGGILQGASAIFSAMDSLDGSRSSPALWQEGFHRIIRIQITVTARSARQERRLMRW
ncbi:MAG: phosphoribosyltransferase [Clostridium fessum]